MILLDTNVLSELMRTALNQAVLSWMDEQTAMDLFICAVTKAEIELGIALLPEGKRKDNLSVAAHEMFGEFSPDRCLSFDEMAAAKFGVLVASRTKIGRPISVEDAQIAAIALAHGLTMATRNTADFENIDDLKVISPWDFDK
jgi:predicted nucleic acid-binding protein